MQVLSPGYPLAFSKFIKLPLKQGSQNISSSKKIFSRKPLNNFQNSSRILSSRLKTQQHQESASQNENKQKKTLQNQLLKQSKQIKFVSTKSSRSLEKLFQSQSAQQLQIWRNQSKKQLVSGTAYNNINSKNNKVIQTSKITKKSCTNIADYKKSILKLSVIFDDQKQEFNIKQNIGSTQFSSNQNVGNEDISSEHSRKNHHQKSKRNQTSSFCYTRDQSLLKGCPNCLISSQKLQDSQDQSLYLSKELEQRGAQIKRLGTKIQRLNKSLKQKDNFKSNLEYEIKLLKQKQTLNAGHKQQIESAYKKLQINFHKLSQQIRYKELENNINKVYKNKSFEMEIKVQTLKEELNRARNKVAILNGSRSSGNLNDRNFLNMKDHHNRNIPQQTRTTKDCKQTEQRRVKHPKVVKVYSEDSIFSLSSEDNNQ